MSVTTIAYSISPSLMEKIHADIENLAFVLDTGDEEHPKWQIEQFDFETRIDETHSILRACGYQKTAESLDLENYFYSKEPNYWDYERYNVWILSPSEIKEIAKEIENATFEELKNVGIDHEATDYDGEVISEDDYDYYVGDIDEIKMFFKKTAEEGNYLLFAVA